MARSGTKLYPPFNLPMHLDKDVKASKLEFLEGSDNVNWPKNINSDRITRGLFGDEPRRDMVPMPFIIGQASVVDFLIQHVTKVILAFAI